MTHGKAELSDIEQSHSRARIADNLQFGVQILDRPQNLIIKELIQYANQTQPIVSALLCIMG